MQLNKTITLTAKELSDTLRIVTADGTTSSLNTALATRVISVYDPVRSIVEALKVLEEAGVSFELKL